MSITGLLTDSFSRRIEYLRISVTERCNLRCTYCHPQVTDAPRSDPLTADDVYHIADAAVQLGVRRIRLTGGEPLLRADLGEIVSLIRLLPGIEDLALTTNGQSLSAHAESLASAGLMRVNVSLDSLDPHAYRSITGGGEVASVLRGIDAAFDAHLSPVKINVVLSTPASLEECNLNSFVELTKGRAIHVRFIEAMPICGHASFLPAQSILDQLAQFGTLAPVSGPDGGGPATYYQLDESQGTVGVITPITNPFCTRCNRLRVTARGEIIPCLFSPTGFSLTQALRGDDPVGDIKQLLQRAAQAKPRRYGDVANPSGISAMHVIGG